MKNLVEISRSSWHSAIKVMLISEVEHYGCGVNGIFESTALKNRLAEDEDSHFCSRFSSPLTVFWYDFLASKKVIPVMIHCHMIAITIGPPDRKPPPGPRLSV